MFGYHRLVALSIVQVKFGLKGTITHPFFPSAPDSCTVTFGIVIIRSQISISAAKPSISL